MIAVAAVEPDRAAGEYVFRFELTGFPGMAPEARIWDIESNQPLAVPQRPKGSQRVVQAFKDWGDKTVYRPWDRFGSVHGDWAKRFPQLLWNAKRDLTFVLEDLHGLLTSNALARPDKARA